MSNQLSSIKTFRPADLLILLLLLTAATLVWPFISSSYPDLVVIFNENRIIARYPLDENRTVTINGSNGPVEIGIVNGMVGINSVVCPHQICQKTGYIQHSHEQILCVPNRILIQIQYSGADEEIDAITY